MVFLGDENETNQTEEGSESEEEMLVEEALKDPRAGNVSVTLPQLKPDFTKLSDLLFKIGSEKSVSAPKRTLLYDLTKQFKDLSQDVYPLIPDMSEEEAKIPKIKPGQVAKRKAKEALKIMENVQKERDEYKKALKRKHDNLDAAPEESSEPSEETEDLETDEMVEDNEEVEAEEVEDNIEEPKAKKKKQKERISNVEVEKMDEKPPKKKKKKKPVETEAKHEEVEQAVEEPVKKKKKQMVPLETENETVEKVVDEPPKKKKKKAKESAEQKPSEVSLETPKQKKKKSSEKAEVSPTKAEKQTHAEINGISEEKPKKKKKKKQKAEETKSVFEDVNWDDSATAAEEEYWKPSEATIQATKIPPKATFLKKAKSHHKEKKAETPTISLLKKEKRRISLQMSENQVSTFNEIDRSMQDSPDIPYQPAKVPKQGVLKSKSASSTPNTDLSKVALMKNTMMNGKSKAAKKLGLNSSRMMFFS